MNIKQELTKIAVSLQTSKEWKEGYEAAKRHVSFYDNPYPERIGGKRFKDWANGWKARELEK